MNEPSRISMHYFESKRIVVERRAGNDKLNEPLNMCETSTRPSAKHMCIPMNWTQDPPFRLLNVHHQNQRLPSAGTCTKRCI